MSDVDAAIESDTIPSDPVDMWSDPEPETVDNTVDPEPVAYDTGTADVVVEPDATDNTPADGTRRAPVALEKDVKDFCDQYVRGELDLPDGKYLTPHALSVLIGQKRGGTKADRPSSGAVQACLKRWVEIKFIEAYGSKEGDEPKIPFAFKQYTQAGQDEGLAAVKKKYSENAKAARAAIREATKAAAANTTPDPEA